jgi:hypothetical protein
LASYLKFLHFYEEKTGISTAEFELGYLKSIEYEARKDKIKDAISNFTIYMRDYHVAKKGTSRYKDTEQLTATSIAAYSTQLFNAVCYLLLQIYYLLSFSSK